MEESEAFWQLWGPNPKLTTQIGKRWDGFLPRMGGYGDRQRG